jgi:hypothetical protein
MTDKETAISLSGVCNVQLPLKPIAEKFGTDGCLTAAACLITPFAE